MSRRKNHFNPEVNPDIKITLSQYTSPEAILLRVMESKHFQTASSVGLSEKEKKRIALTAIEGHHYGINQTNQILIQLVSQTLLQLPLVIVNIIGQYTETENDSSSIDISKIKKSTLQNLIKLIKILLKNIPKITDCDYRSTTVRNSDNILDDLKKVLTALADGVLEAQIGYYCKPVKTVTFVAETLRDAQFTTNSLPVATLAQVAQERHPKEYSRFVSDIRTLHDNLNIPSPYFYEVSKLLSCQQYTFRLSDKVIIKLKTLALHLDKIIEVNASIELKKILQILAIKALGIKHNSNKKEFLITLDDKNSAKLAHVYTNEILLNRTCHYIHTTTAELKAMSSLFLSQSEKNIKNQGLKSARDLINNHLLINSMIAPLQKKPLIDHIQKLHNNEAGGSFKSMLADLLIHLDVTPTKTLTSIQNSY